MDFAVVLGGSIMNLQIYLVEAEEGHHYRYCWVEEEQGRRWSLREGE
jgi:hypothetical protein